MRDAGGHRADATIVPPRGSAKGAVPCRPASWIALIAASLVLGGCAVAPTDGPPRRVPDGLEQVPDAEPRIEPIRVGGPNKPYEVLGRRYVPFTHERPFTERGLASWYGRKFHGRPTAMGETYDMYAMTAAHPTLPLPSYARIRNPANGREIVVRVNDRGPFHPGRIVDLSYAAALRLDLLRGVAPVELERITPEAIRTGRWRTVAAPADGRPASTIVDAANPAPVVAVAAPLPVSASPGLPAASTGAAPAPRTGTPAAGSATPEVSARVVPIAAQASGYWLQLGAFRLRSGAEEFHRAIAAELDWLAQGLIVFDDTPLFRLQAGPYSNRADAQDAADRVRQAVQLVPVVVERP